jgi:hypothetical protein
MTDPPATSDSLFSSEPRRAGVTLPHGAAEYVRLDRGAGPALAHVRGTLDGLYRRLPAHAQPRIADGFRRPALAEHLAAFWELYLHELALCLGFAVDVDIGREDTARSLSSPVRRSAFEISESTPRCGSAC